MELNARISLVAEEQIAYSEKLPTKSKHQTRTRRKTEKKRPKVSEQEQQEILREWKEKWKIEKEKRKKKGKLCPSAMAELSQQLKETTVEEILQSSGDMDQVNNMLREWKDIANSSFGIKTRATGLTTLLQSLIFDQEDLRNAKLVCGLRNLDTLTTNVIKAVADLRLRSKKVLLDCKNSVLAVDARISTCDSECLKTLRAYAEARDGKNVKKRVSKQREKCSWMMSVLHETAIHHNKKKMADREQEELKQLKEHFVVHSILGDGNCVFRAVSAGKRYHNDTLVQNLDSKEFSSMVFLRMEAAAAMRTLKYRGSVVKEVNEALMDRIGGTPTMDWIKSTLGEQQHVTDDEKISVYSHIHGTDKTFGERLQLQALAECKGVSSCIRVLRSNGDVLETFNKKARKSDGSNTISLLLTCYGKNGAHYDLLLPKTPATVPSQRQSDRSSHTITVTPQTITSGVTTKAPAPMPPSQSLPLQSLNMVTPPEEDESPQFLDDVVPLPPKGSSKRYGIIVNIMPEHLRSKTHFLPDLIRRNWSKGGGDPLPSGFLDQKKLFFLDAQKWPTNLASLGSRPKENTESSGWMKKIENDLCTSAEVKDAELKIKEFMNKLGTYSSARATEIFVSNSDWRLQNTKKGQSATTGCLTKYYECHRSGKYRNRKEENRKKRTSEKQFIPREQKKNAKKNGCKAKATVSYHSDGKVKVELFSCHNHSSDVFEGLLRHDRIKSNKALFDKIVGLFDDGKTNREVLVEVQGRVRHRSTRRLAKKHDADHLEMIKLTRQDIANLRESLGMSTHSKRRHKNDKEAVKIMYEEEQTSYGENSPFLYLKLPGEAANESFSLKNPNGKAMDGFKVPNSGTVRDTDLVAVIQTNSQRELFRKHGRLACVDSTHDVTAYGFKLYSIVCINKANKGVCVAWMIATRSDAKEGMYEIFCEAVKHRMSQKLECDSDEHGAGTVPHVEVVLSDCVTSAEKDFKKVFGSHIIGKWCTFHVLKAWGQHLKEVSPGAKCKIRLNADNEELNPFETKDGKVISVFQAMRSALYATSVPVLYALLNRIKEHLKRYHPRALEYLKKDYLRPHVVKRWAHAHFPSWIKTYCNNHVEAFHAVLKTLYLANKQNRRLESLIEVLWVSEEDIYVKSIREDLGFDKPKVTVNRGVVRVIDHTPENFEPYDDMQFYDEQKSNVSMNNSHLRIKGAIERFETELKKMNKFSMSLLSPEYLVRNLSSLSSMTKQLKGLTVLARSHHSKYEKEALIHGSTPADFKTTLKLSSNNNIKHQTDFLLKKRRTVTKRKKNNSGNAVEKKARLRKSQNLVLSTLIQGDES